MSVTAVPIQPLTRGSMVKFWIGMALLVAASAALAWTGTRDHIWQTTPSGLRFQVIQAGEGPRPGPSDVAKFDYVGRLENGREFDSSEGRGPAEIPIFGVVPGFAEGLQMMQKGSTYRFRIPPDIGYGPQGQPPVVPPNSTIEFEVSLRDFRPMSREEMQQMQQMQMMQMMQQQGMSPDGAPPTGEPPAGAPPQGGNSAGPEGGRPPR